ncbi:12326_t:CDS:2, partial [Entrophospora sp. SA101]
MYRITRHPNYIIKIPSIDVMSIKPKLSTTVTARYYYLSGLTRHVTNKQQQLPRIIVQDDKKEQKSNKSTFTNTTSNESTPNKSSSIDNKSNAATTTTINSGSGSGNDQSKKQGESGGVTYGGAVYYSLKNDAFRSTFTKHVYGAEQVVNYVVDLHRQGTFDRFERNLTDITQYTKVKGKEIYYNLNTKISEILKSDDDVKKEDEEKTKVKGKEIYHNLNTKVSEVLKSDDDIKKEDEENTKVKDKEIYHNLNTKISEVLKSDDDVKKEEQENIQRQLNEQILKLNQILASNEKAVDEYIRSKEEEMKRQFERDKQSIYNEFNQQLVTELKRQLTKHKEELKNELIRQAINLERGWTRDVKLVVEQERAGRLARLDHICQRLKMLELLSVDNAEHLDKSLKAHKLWRTLKSLQEIINSKSDGDKRPFSNEITMLKKIGSGDEVIVTVLSTIDDSISSNGIESTTNLTNRFNNVKEAIRRASLIPEGGGGVFAHLLSRISSRLLFRKHGLVEGNDVEAILARTQYYLDSNDLDNATRELNQLVGWPKKLAEDWLKAARNHLEIKQAIEVIEAQAILS